MPIEMPKGLPFSVDTWTAASKRKRYHFLTHAHRDHLAGVSCHASYPIYCTHFTKDLVLRCFPQLEESLFVEIEVGKPVAIDDPDGDFSVTAFDANHCPGAVMFLFEGVFGNVLHTGDCRLTPDCLQCLPSKYITKKGKAASQLDYLFLDCTFGRYSLQIPSKQSAIQQVINCIWKHPSAPVVYLACDLLGQEEILVEVFKAFGSKIYVDTDNNSECYQALMLVAPIIFSQDKSSRFQVVEGFPRLGERTREKLAEARGRLQPEPLFIRPSTQWYVTNDQRQKPRLDEAERDDSGIWHVCYSMHSSRDELEWALQLLRPKWVISTTPPCRAMELDYVKNHCFKTRITADDPLWKLLNVGTGKPDFSPPTLDSVVMKSSDVSASVIKVSEDCGVKPELSLPSKAQPITLFGRARLGLEDLEEFPDENLMLSVPRGKSVIFPVREKIVVEQRDLVVASVQEDNPKPVIEGHVDGNIFNVDEPSIQKPQGNNFRMKTSCYVDGGNSRIELYKSFNNDEPSVEKSQGAGCKKDISSKGISESMKKLYRSMNVPLPRPLPSLEEQMDASKRIKFGFGASYRVNYNYSSHFSS